MALSHIVAASPGQEAAASLSFPPARFAACGRVSRRGRTRCKYRHESDRGGFDDASGRPSRAATTAERKRRYAKLIQITAASRSISMVAPIVELRMASALEARRLWIISKIIL